MKTAVKTPKLFIGGQFVRSESGRTYEAQGANVPLASRKDVRDAVAAARKGFEKWSSTTAYNRGQILYRLGEMLNGRTFTGTDQSELNKAMDLAVHYAGWTDKFSALLSSINPVAGPIHNFTRPEPIGVVSVVAPEESPLVGLMLSLLPPLTAGCSLVALVSEKTPLPGLELAEAWATSDLPAGTVNFLSGKHEELLPILCEHVDVDAIDSTKIHESATHTIKRLPRFSETTDALARIEAFVEHKTVWHSLGW